VIDGREETARCTQPNEPGNSPGGVVHGVSASQVSGLAAALEREDGGVLQDLSGCASSGDERGPGCPDELDRGALRIAAAALVAHSASITSSTS
jgi:hypothetical protein